MSSKYTEDNFVPIKSIDNGMIILENGFRVTGVKIMPKNIFILDQISQEIVIDQLMNLYNMIDYEFWIIVADRPVDIDLYVSNLQLQFNNIQQPARRKLISEDIKKANLFITNNVVDTEYYLIFRDRDVELINKRIRNLISYLASAGLTAMMTSNNDLRTILDNFLNGGQDTNFGVVMS
jgi:hypothetical protein